MAHANQPPGNQSIITRCLAEKMALLLPVQAEFALVTRFGLDSLLQEAVLLQQSRSYLLCLLPQMSGTARKLIEALLYDKAIPS